MISLGAVLTSTMVFSKSFIEPINKTLGNFKHVYLNENLRKEFFKFLENVFHLFPENKFHQLLFKTTKEKKSDKEIYEETQSKLDEITPYFAAFKYKLPALYKQKEEMAKQTLVLLGKKQKGYSGYLEIGSSGRYLDYLKDKRTFNGQMYYADWEKPGYGVSEMVDRGQVSVGATYIPMNDYETKFNQYVKKESLDLVTVYIGFHHCPLNLRESFIASIRDLLRKDGKLILRDHDCKTQDEKAMVGLAHDVFNLGTNETWEYNQKELRNFYSLDFIQDFVEKMGFTFDRRTLFQEGDPTKNALMLFTKK